MFIAHLVVLDMLMDATAPVDQARLPAFRAVIDGYFAASHQQYTVSTATAATHPAIVAAVHQHPLR